MSPADGSRLQPQDDRGEHHHRPVIDGAFLVAGSQPTPLFEPIDAALDDIATRIDRGIEEERSPWPSRSLRALVASLGNSVGNVSAAEQLTTSPIAVALVSDEAVWTRPWSPGSCGARDPDAIQDGLQLGTVMPMSWGNDDGERPSATVAGEMKLGG